MSYWTYRIIKTKEVVDDKEWTTYGIYEVYYNKNDEPCGRTESAIDLKLFEEPGDDCKEDLVNMLENMLKDAKRYPVLEEPIEWGLDDIRLEGTIRIETKDGVQKDFYCPDCGDIITKWYPWEENEIKTEVEYRCYDCNKLIDLEELGYKEITKEEEENA